MVDVELLDGERIDDLQINGTKIIQNPQFFCFGMDAVLLSNFVKAKSGEVIADLGSGNGIISILTAVKKPVKKVHAIEIQEHMAAMAKRSVQMNGLEEKIEVHNIDLKDAPEVLGKNTFDLIVTNPPYTIKGAGIKNIEDAKTIARHEIKCTLEDVIRTSYELLKFKGKLFMIHRPDRLVDILCTMRQYNIEPKYLRFVHPREGQRPSMILIEASKQGGRELKVLEPLYIYNNDGEYTKEILDIYS